MSKIFKVHTFWDEEAKVWVAEGINVPGLCTEATTIPKLVKKLKIMVPELLEANGLLKRFQTDVPFELIPEKINITAHVNA